MAISLKFPFFLIIAFLGVHGYPDGAPASDAICTSMTPFHGEQTLLGRDPPFNIDLNRVYIKGTGRITVTVKSKDPSRYKLSGALFMVKKPGDAKQAYGHFDPDGNKEDMKVTGCFGKEGSALTHSSNKPKTALSFQWIAPNDTSATYEFHATLVRDFNSFWADYIYPMKIRVDANAPAKASNFNLPHLPLILASAVEIIALSLVFRNLT